MHKPPPEIRIAVPCRGVSVSLLLLIVLLLAACQPISPEFSEESISAGAGTSVVTESAASAETDVSGPFAQVRASNLNTCAVTKEGAVYCWGDNFDGQLGAGGTTDGGLPSPLPLRVIDLPESAGLIRPGASHTCALSDTGALYCWGYNETGQLGTGDGVASSVPVAASSYEGGVLDMGTGNEFTCVLLEGDRIQCLGYNQFGALGADTPEANFAPVDIEGTPSGIVDIDVAGWGMCALTDVGDMWCWGRNHAGQLGDGTFENRSEPAKVTGLDGQVAKMAVKHAYACAITTAGGLKCWGRNAGGQLGNGTTITATTPVDVVGLSQGVVDVSLGARLLGHACAIVEGGGVKCWGSNDVGQLGTGSNVSSTVPIDVPLPGPASQLALGETHACALLQDGRLFCWGGNPNGEVGDGTFEDRFSPVEVHIDPNATLPTGEVEDVESLIAEAKEGDGLLVVAVGDWVLSQGECADCASAVDQYADALAETTGRKVTAINLAPNANHTIAEIQERLDSESDLQAALSAADVVLVGAAQWGLPMQSGGVDVCDGPTYDDRPDWSLFTPECSVESAEMARPWFDQLFGDIAALRAGQPTRFIAINAYNDWINYVRGDGSTVGADGIAATKMVTEDWNRVLCEVAESHGYLCADLYHAINGADGLGDPTAFFASDYTLNSAGHDRAAEVFKALGVDAP